MIPSIWEQSVDLVVSDPGKDAPDDNYDVGDGYFSYKNKIDTAAKIAIMQTGFINSMATLSADLKQVYFPTWYDFDPAMVSRHPVLVIPSGGLYGLQNSASFKQKLQRYIADGGTVIVLSQQHGNEYNALPGDLTAYGWVEDQSCQWNSSYIDQYHQILSGQSSAKCDLVVDGYFTRWPSNSTILLRRTKNGMPCMLMYPYGNGRVIVTSMYEDWAYTHGQSTDDGRKLVRDMLAWAKQPDSLPEFSPGANVNLELTIINDTTIDAAQTRITVLTPDIESYQQQTYIQTLGAGNRVHVYHSISAIANRPGIWYVNYELLDANGNVIKQNTLARRFAVSSPQTGAGVQMVAFGITSESEQYLNGTDIPFTVHIYNQTNSDTTVRASFSCYSHGPFTDTTVSVPAHAEVSFIKIVRNAHYSTRFYGTFTGLHREYLGQQMKGFYVIYPMVSISAAADKSEYRFGETATVIATMTNSSSIGIASSLTLTVKDAAGQAFYTQNRAMPFMAREAKSDTESFSIPRSAAMGTCWATFNLYGNGSLIGQKTIFFQIPSLRLAITPIVPGTLRQGSNSLSFSIESINDLAVTSGTLNATLKDPAGSAIWTSATPFSLNSGEVKTIDLSAVLPPLNFGTYVLEFQAQYDGLATKVTAMQLPSTCMIAISPDNSSQRVRESVEKELEILNTGRFEYSDLSVSTVIPGMLNKTRTIALASGRSISLPIGFSIPANQAAGAYSGTVTLSLGSGNSISKTFAFVIPKAQIALSLDSAHCSGGQQIRFKAVNKGGVDAALDNTITVTDSTGFAIINQTASVTVAAGDSVFFPAAVPANAVNGAYQAYCRGIVSPSADTAILAKELSITGISAQMHVRTDKLVYGLSETTTALADVAMASGVIDSGRLDLKASRIVQTSKTFTDADWDTSGISSPVGSVYPYEPDFGQQVLDHNDDSFAGPFNLGFAISLYGMQFNQIFVNNNGNITLQRGLSTYTPFAFPNTMGVTIIAPFFADVDTRDSASGVVYMNTSKPGQVVITWDRVGYFGNHADKVNSFQLVLQDDSTFAFVDGDHIGFIYGDLQWTTGDASGGSGGFGGTPAAAGFDRGDGVHAVTLEGSFSSNILNQANTEHWFSGAGDVLALPSLYMTYDAGKQVQWKSIAWNGNTPAGTSMKMVTRTANSEDELGTAPWSGYYSTSGSAIGSPAGRWIAVKVIFESRDPRNLVPVLNDVTVDFLERQQVWEDSQTVHITGTQSYSVVAGAMGTPGRYVLEGAVKTSIGQTASTDEYPFYVDAGPLFLTFNTNKNVYRPGETVTIAGEAANHGTQSFTGVAVRFVSNGVEAFNQSFNLGAGQSQPFSCNTTAPQRTFVLSGFINNKEISEQIDVEAPRLDISYSVPDIVGHEPFLATVTLANPRTIDANVTVDIGGSRQTLLIPGGQSRIAQRQLSITGSMNLTILITGDVSQTYRHSIAYGESATISVSPQSLYPEGTVIIPYSVSNTGSLPVTVPIAFTMGDRIINRSFNVPAGQTASGNLEFDQVAGSYELAYRSPFGNGSSAYRVARANNLQVHLEVIRHSVPKVLILRDNYSENPLSTVLTDAGMDVAIAPGYLHQYDGANPSPAGFDVIIMPCSNYYGNIMPQSGQQALADFVNAGGGFISTEWATYGVRYYNNFSSMSDLLLYEPAQWGADSGYETFTVQTQHPITQRVPPSFSVSYYHYGNTGGLKVGATRLISGNLFSNAVAVKQQGLGRVVQFAIYGQHLAEMAGTDAAMRQLLINAVEWAGKSNEGNGGRAKVVVQNNGSNSFDGNVQITSSFYSKTDDAQIAAGSSKNFAYDLDLVNVEPNTYKFTASALLAGTVVAKDTASLTVSRAQFDIITQPRNPSFSPGADVTMQFVIKNTGMVEGDAEVRLAALDLLDHTARAWIAPGMEQTENFNFQIPDDLPDGEYTAQFYLNGELTEIPFTVSGISVTVAASLDKTVYRPGDTALLALRVGNTGTMNPSLVARATSGSHEASQTFDLGSSGMIQLRLPIDENTPEKIFYGIYHSSGRGIYLNALYVRVMKGDILVYTEKGVYEPGDTVTAFVETTENGDLWVSTATGFEQTIAVSGPTSFQFALPSSLVSGTFSISYQMGGNAGVAYFDVNGLEAKVLEVTLDKATYDPVDSLSADFTVQSNGAVDVTIKAWILDPSQNYTPILETDKSLAQGRNRFSAGGSLSSRFSGLHKLVYSIYTRGAVPLALASGSEAFDVRKAAIISIAPAERAYAEGRNVVLNASTFACTEYSGTLEVLLGRNILASLNAVLSGAGHYALDAGILPPGTYELTARLGNGDGIISTKSASVSVIDSEAPATPSGLVIQIDGNIANLTWTPNSERDLAGYLMYRNGERLNAQPSLRTVFRNEGIVAGVAYAYHVTAVDRSGNESVPSADVVARIDNTAPVITMSPASSITSTASVTLNWSVVDDIAPNPSVNASHPSPTTFTKTGAYPISIVATDAQGNRAEKAITITVNIPNTAPHLDPIGNKSVNEGQLLKIMLSVTDPDSDAMVFSSDNLPRGATLDAANGLFTWTPAKNQAGEYVVNFTVTDNGTPPKSASQQARITVAKVNIPPPNRAATYTLTLAVNDAAGGTVSPSTPMTVSDGVPTAISASANSGYVFDRWNIVSGSVALGDAYGTATTAALTSAATIRADFVAAGSMTVAITNGNGSEEVYLFAATGWIGQKKRIGSGSISNLKPGAYVLAVKDANRRTEYGMVTVAAGATASATVALRNCVQQIADTIAPVRVGGSQISAGGAASPVMQDFNNDGLADLLIARASGDFRYYHNSPGGYVLATGPQLATGGDLSWPGGIRCIRTADWNGDNRLDLVALDYGGKFVLFDNASSTGGMVYAAGQILYTSSLPSATGFDFADLNGDGYPDLVIGYADGSVRIAASSASFVWNDPAWDALASAKLQDKSDINVGTNAAPTALEMTGDGLPDLVVGNGSGTAFSFRNRGDGTWLARGSLNFSGKALGLNGGAALSSHYGVPGKLPTLVMADGGGAIYTGQMLLAGDLNGDGVVDIVDLQIFGDAGGLTPSGAKWQWKANLDLTPNGINQIIDVLDLAIFGDSWGAQQ